MILIMYSKNFLKRVGIPQKEYYLPNPIELFYDSQSTFQKVEGIVDHLKLAIMLFLDSIY